MEFDHVCSVSLVKTISVKYHYKYGNQQEFCAELETISWNNLSAKLTVDNLLCVHVFILDLDLVFCCNKYIPVSSTALSNTNTMIDLSGIEENQRKEKSLD